MLVLNRDKFRRNKELRERLLATNSKTLVNSLPSTACSQRELEERLFWGQVKIGKTIQGQNHLGLVISEVRKSIQSDSEISTWLNSQFQLLKADKKDMPVIQLEVFKEGVNIESVQLKGQAVFLIGRQQNRVDLPLLHESISREHAALILDEQKGAMIVDLGSTTGTIVNGKSVIDHTGVPLKDGDEVIFGASTRIHKVTVDYSRFRKSLEAK